MLRLGDHPGSVRTIAYSADGRQLAAGGDGFVYVWDLTRGQPRYWWDNLSTRVIGVAFVRDGTAVIAALEDGTIREYPLEDIEPRTLFEDRGRMRKVVMSDDSEWLFTAYWDIPSSLTGQLQRRHLHRNEVATIERPHEKSLTTIALAGDTLVSAGLDGTLKLWPARDHRFGKECVTLKTDTTLIQAITISPDGSTLAAGCQDGTIRLWDVAAKQLRAELRGHSWVVFDLAFSPDSRALVSGSPDKTVRIWDVAAGCAKQTFTWHANGVTSVRYSPDGLTIAAASDDKTIVVWDAD